ncbi:MAG: hypothetical protein ACOZIN_08485 [Myxococcota bacterium]
MNARFRVFGRFNGAPAATVIVNRASGIITVRPLRRRKVYELPLAFVAELVMWRILKAEAAEKRARRKAKR